MPSRRLQDAFLWADPAFGLPIEEQWLLLHEHWNSHDGDAWGTRWTDRNGTAGYNVDIQGNRGRLRTGNTIGSYGDYAFASRTHFQADVDIRVSLRFVTVTECYPQIFFRDAGSGNRYQVQFLPSADTISLYRETGYSGTLIGTSTVGFNPAANDIYHVRIHANGSDIKVKWWADGASEPGAWAIAVSDGTYSGTSLSLSIGSGASAAYSYIDFDDLRVYESFPLGGGLPATTDFTGTNGSAWPSPWVTDGTGAADIQSNKGRLQADSGGYDYHWAVYNEPLVADMEVAGSVTIDSADEQYIRIFLGGEAISANSIPDAYALHILPSYGGWEMQVFSGYSGSTLSGSFVSLTMAASDVVHFKAQRIGGSTIRAKVWLNGDPEPGSWGWSGTDTTHVGGLYSAVFIQSGAAATGRTALFDDIVFSEAVAGGPAVPEAYVRVGGTFTKMEGIYVREGGSWVEKTSYGLAVRVGGSWTSVPTS